MAQFFHRSANNIARISMILGVILAGTAFYVYTQVARSSYLTGRYVENNSRFNLAINTMWVTMGSIVVIAILRLRRPPQPECRLHKRV